MLEFLSKFVGSLPYSIKHLKQTAVNWCYRKKVIWELNWIMSVFGTTINICSLNKKKQTKISCSFSLKLTILFIYIYLHKYIISWYSSDDEIKQENKREDTSQHLSSEIDIYIYNKLYGWQIKGNTNHSKMLTTTPLCKILPHDHKSHMPFHLAHSLYYIIVQLFL